MSDPHIRRIVSEFMEGTFISKKGTVTSYDPATHKAKVMIQPEGLETGWLPIVTMLVGDGFGLSFGLSGGDEVLVHFEGGDLNAGVIAGALYASEAPYPAKPKSFMLTHTSGSYIRMFNDGTVQVNAEDHLFLKSNDKLTLSAPGLVVFNYGTTQSWVTDSIPGGPEFNPDLHVDHEETE